MEKLKITQEQANVIEELKGDFDLKHSIYKHRCMDWAQPHFGSLSDKELAIALYVDNGYEVEPEFKVGDCVVTLIGTVAKITELQNGNSGNYAVLDVLHDEEAEDFIASSLVNLRHATPEEIATEKTRRWWAKHDRGASEIKQGDIIMREGRRIFEVTADPKSHRYGCYTGDDQFDFDIEDFVDKNWEVVCFREDRKDI